VDLVDWPSWRSRNAYNADHGGRSRDVPSERNVALVRQSIVVASGGRVISYVTLEGIHTDWLVG